jgi:prevent-host-death family protein
MPTLGKDSVTIHEAKTNLSRLLAEVEAGAEIVIKRGKQPVAKLVPIAVKPRPVAGKYKGMIDIPDSFFDPMSDEELALWHGGDV